VFDSVVAPPTLPTRDRSDKTWRTGDVVIDGGTRYRIRALNPKTKKVTLEAMNATNAAIWWNTTTDRLPEKAA
jgi:hypothetical protein